MYSERSTVVSLTIVPAILTIIGNTVFFVTLLKTPSLHTPSNLVLGALCLTDLLAGALCQPIHIAMLLCKSVPIRSLLYSTFYFIFHLSCFNSFVFSLLITLDRYAAICHPYRYLEHATCKRYAYTAVAIFVLSAIYAIIEITYYQNFKVIFWSFEVSLQLLFMILVLMIYIKIYKVVLQQRKRIAMNGNFTSRRQSRIPARERSKTHTVTIILAVFIACYTPFTVYYLMFTLKLLGKIKAYNLYELGVWAYYFVLLNSCLNPIIYCARSQEIRRAALGIFVPSFAYRHPKSSGNAASNAEIIRGRINTECGVTSQL